MRAAINKYSAQTNFVILRTQNAYNSCSGQILHFYSFFSKQELSPKAESSEGILGFLSSFLGVVLPLSRFIVIPSRPSCTLRGDLSLPTFKFTSEFVADARDIWLLGEGEIKLGREDFCCFHLDSSSIKASPAGSIEAVNILLNCPQTTTSLQVEN